MTTITLYRPVGPAELAQIRESRWPALPPRLQDHPIFYPVTNHEYAAQIARDWNVKADGTGFVTRFAVDAAFLRRFPEQKVGGAIHTEFWIPAADLPEFNSNIVGVIEVIEEFSSATVSARSELSLGAAVNDKLPRMRPRIAAAQPRR